MKKHMFLLTGLCATIFTLTYLAGSTHAAEGSPGGASPTEVAPSVYHPSTSSLPVIQSDADEALSDIFKDIRDSEYNIDWQDGAEFGWSVASSLDYDQNDYDGVIVGMPYLDHSGYTDSGRVAVWEGSQNKLATGQTAFETSYLAANAHMGYSVCPFTSRYASGIVVGLPGLNNVAIFKNQ